jgi:type I restriction enzyme R subunit
VESRRLSELIKKTIEEYHQQRINETEYLARVRGFEEEFFNGTGSNVPSSIRDNAAAIAFYNLASEELKEALASKAGRIDMAAELAIGIDAVVKANVFGSGHPVIDWQKNEDVKGRMRIGMDDLLFEARTKYNLEISFDQIDQLIAECIKVAEAKYKS